MAEADDLKKAHGLITAGRKDLALALLQKLIASKDVNMRVDAGLALLVALDHLTQTRELLKVTDKTRCDAAAAGNSDVHAYLLSKKAELLSNKVSGLAGERRNLNLASLFPRILGDGLWDIDRPRVKAVDHKCLHRDGLVRARRGIHIEPGLFPVLVIAELAHFLAPLAFNLSLKGLMHSNLWRKKRVAQLAQFSLA